MAQISVATRLAAYGLTEDQVKLSNLRLENNQTRVVSYSTMPDQVIQLQPQTVHQLKSWVGVPDAAFAHLSPPSIPAPAIHLRKVDEGTTTEEHAALSAA